MFFRLKRSPSGQCLQLLESFRNAHGQPRHRVVVSLGDAAIPEADRALIARLVEQRLCGQPDLECISDNAQALDLVDSISKRIEREGRWRQPPAATTPLQESNAVQEVPNEKVVVDEITHTHTTPLGPSLAGWQAWQTLGMPALLESLGFNPAQQQAAAASVINRLVDPGSERSLVDWLEDSSLPELMKMETGPAGKDRFYRISDLLFKHRQAIEEHLRDAQDKLFQTDRTLLLYDLTNSYFEGEALGNPKARRGKSKEKRNDCPQVVLGMVFDRNGFELAHRVFDGNKSDGKSLIEMIQEMDKLVPLQNGQNPRPMVLLDGGIATKTNLALLREKQYHYLVNDSRRGRSAYREEFSKKEEFTLIVDREDKSEVKVRKMSDPLWVAQEPSPTEASADASKEPSPKDAPDTLIFCWSEGREQKEQAIRSGAEEKYLKELGLLSKRVKEGKLKEAPKIQRAIGRIQKAHSRVQRFYQVDLVEEPQGKELKWTRMDQKSQEDENLLGCYVLRTDEGSRSAQEIWNLYMTLSKAEDGFRSLKGDLGLRPNYHQIERRVEGHIWITIMAYHLLSWIQGMLRQSGDNRRWATIRRVLQTHCYTTLIVPTRGGKTYRIRKAGEPEEGQKTIYDKIKVNWKDLPKTKLEVETGTIL